MIKCICSRHMGKSEKDWLHSTFHFSFAEYYHPDNLQFGALRVVNDDLFDPYSGFDIHPHKDMEIVSYVIDGVLTHQDSMGNRRELTRGQVQYMSAGTGVYHSEHNLTEEPLRFLQIWIFPDKENYVPQYGDYQYQWEERENKWLKIVSGNKEKAPVSVHQDVEISVISIEAGKQQTYSLDTGRKAYLIQIEGSGLINNHVLEEKDAAKIVGERVVNLSATTRAHYILFDLAE